MVKYESIRHAYNEEHVLLPAYCCTVGHPDNDSREAISYRGEGAEGRGRTTVMMIHSCLLHCSKSSDTHC